MCSDRNNFLPRDYANNGQAVCLVRDVNSRSETSSLRDDIGPCIVLVFCNRACALILPFQTERAKVTLVGNIFDILSWLGLICRRLFDGGQKVREQNEDHYIISIVCAGEGFASPKIFLPPQQHHKLTNAILNSELGGNRLPRDFRIRRTSWMTLMRLFFPRRC